MDLTSKAIDPKDIRKGMVLWVWETGLRYVVVALESSYQPQKNGGWFFNAREVVSNKEMSLGGERGPGFVLIHTRDDIMNTGFDVN